MKKLKIFTIISCLSFFFNSTFAQEEVPPKVLVMGVPQYLFKNGIRVDIDVATNNYRSWWVFSPQYYINVSDLEGSLRNRNIEELHGYGLSIHRKGFLSRNTAEKGAYISGGLGFQHFNILTNAERWVELSNNGLNFMELVEDNYHIFINKVMTEAIIGFQKEIVSRLYIDIYAGVGLRYSFYDQPTGSDIKFNKNITDYGYTGTAFIGGVRIGVGF